MREKLQERLGQRMLVTGTFERFGTKPAYCSPYPDVTLLLLDIRDADGNKLTDHLWFNQTKGFRSVNLTPGCRVQFEARANYYVAGCRGERRLDCKLSYPTRIRLLSE